MRERGVDLTVHTSKGLADLPELNWDWVITMGCGDQCPSLPTKYRDDWALPDPRDMDHDSFNKVRDDIERRVLALLESHGKRI